MRLKPILTVASVIVSLFVADRVATAALDRLTLHSDYRLSQLYAGKIDADVVVFGSSRAIHMLDPGKLSAATGVKVYDIGLNRIDAATEQVFVEDYLSHNPKPKLVILEVSNLNWADSAAAEYAMYSRHSPALAKKLDSESTSILPWRHIFSSYAYNGQLIWRVMLGLKSRNDQQGSPLNQKITPAVVEAFAKRKWNYDAQPAKLETLKRTVQALESQGVRTELVLAPFHSSTLGGWHTRYVTTLKQAFPGRAIHDYALSVPGDAGYSDPLHLNAAGREAFAPSLAKLIDESVPR